jgi:hypothetical protein
MIYYLRSEYDRCELPPVSWGIDREMKDRSCPFRWKRD